MISSPVDEYELSLHDNQPSYLHIQLLRDVCSPCMLMLSLPLYSPIQDITSRDRYTGVEIRDVSEITNDTARVTIEKSRRGFGSLCGNNKQRFTM